MIKGWLTVLSVLVLANTAAADYKACRSLMRDKLWEQAFEACHAEALKADRGDGDKRALNRVAMLYRDGRGTGRDYTEAMRWFRKAADKGSGYAMSSIGYLYGRGLGVPEDKEAALRWYRKSAELGHYLGQYNYGISLWARVDRGQGSREDLVTGYMYMLLSKQTGRGSSRFREERIGWWMDRAEQDLTYGQIDEAKRRARAWRRECAKDKLCKRLQRIK